MASKDDIDLHVNARESLATSPLLLRLLLWKGLIPSRWWWRERLKRAAVAGRVFEVPTVTQSVAHLLVVQTLAIEDFVQCPYVVVSRCTASSGYRWPHDMYFISWPLVLGIVRLRVPLLRCLGSRLWLTDEVPSPFVIGDVDVRFSEELFQGGR